VTESHGHDRTMGPSGDSPFFPGVWLTSARLRVPIETLLLRMLEPNQPHAGLRRSIIEELSRPAKFTDVVLEYLGLQSSGWTPRERSGCSSPIRGRDPTYGGRRFSVPAATSSDRRPTPGNVEAT